MHNPCPHCGCEEAEFLGYSDGAGDYGDELDQEYRCVICYETWSEVYRDDDEAYD